MHSIFKRVAANNVWYVNDKKLKIHANKFKIEIDMNKQSSIKLIKLIKNSHKETGVIGDAFQKGMQKDL